MTLTPTFPNVEDVQVDALTNNPTNPRSITTDRFEQLKRTLAAERDLLRVRPIIALTDGRVIAGNMRLRAATDLGWETVPAVVVDLERDRANLWTLLDNQPFGEWDELGLAEMLYELGEAGVDLDLTGFPEADLRSLLEQYGPGFGAAGDDANPPLDETKPGRPVECPACGATFVPGEGA